MPSTTTREGNVRLAEGISLDDEKRAACQQALYDTVYDTLETHIRYIMKQPRYKPVDFSTRNLNLVDLPKSLHEETLCRILAPMPDLGQHYHQTREVISSSSYYVSVDSVSVYDEDEDFDDEIDEGDPMVMLAILLFYTPPSPREESMDMQWCRNMFDRLYQVKQTPSNLDRG
jgi:hypothetical protein